MLIKMLNMHKKPKVCNQNDEIFNINYYIYLYTNKIIITRIYNL